MIEFEGRSIPPQDLTDFLRTAATEPFVQPQSDLGDHRPLDWVERLLVAHPELNDRIKRAAKNLIAEADPIVALRVLEVCRTWPGGFVSDLSAAIADAAPALAGVVDRSVTNDRTLLGRAVDELVASPDRDEVAAPAAEALLAITNPRDGVPKAPILGWLRLDPSSDRDHALRRVFESAELTPSDWSTIAGMLFRAGEPRLDRALAVAATSSSTAARKNFATAVDAIRTRLGI